MGRVRDGRLKLQQVGGQFRFDVRKPFGWLG